MKEIQNGHVFLFRSFDIVSNFDIRASDFVCLYKPHIFQLLNNALNTGS
jgi:hypothetical protein